MKRTSLLPVISAAIVAASLFVGDTARAATFYWDTDSGTGGVGGTGTWNTGNLFWNSALSGSGSVSGWINANRDTADFRGTPGTVSVSSGISAGAVLFNAGGYTLSGSDITLGRAAGTGNTTILNYVSGSGTNTISSNIIVDDIGTVDTAANYTINNSGTGSLILGGNLTLNYSTGTPAGNKSFIFQTGISAASITFNGNISQGANGGAASLLGVTFGQGGTTRANALALNGTFFVTGSNTYSRGTSIFGGTIIVSNSNALGTNTVSFGSSGARGDMKLLTDGAITISNALSLSGAATSQTYIGGSTADDSTFSGNFNMNAFGSNGSPGTISTPDAIFTAVAGGRVNFSGALQGSASIPRGIIKEGAGIVAFTNGTGNTYKGFTQVNEGTLLLMNATGSATGDGSQIGSGTAGVIVAAGATLGGTGISTVLASASAASANFTPGDMTKAGVSSIGALRLHGGLNAASGATFNIQVNGALTDSVNFGTGALDLDSTVNFTFTSLGTVQTGAAYTVLAGTGDWSASAPTFTFNAPSGYMLDTAYGAGTGYVFDTVSATRSLSVQFIVIPEPGTFVLLLSGMGVLGYWRRTRRGLP